MSVFEVLFPRVTVFAAQKSGEKTQNVPNNTLPAASNLFNVFNSISYKKSILLGNLYLICCYKFILYIVTGITVFMKKMIVMDVFKVLMNQAQ